MNEVVDTNVILRFLVGDHAEQRKQAEGWFKEAEMGTRKLIVTAVVIAETCFVLESVYKKSREEVAQKLTVFVSQPWFSVPEREILMQMWRLYSQGIHFVDAYLVAWKIVNGDSILSFDQKLGRLTSTSKS